MNKNSINPRLATLLRTGMEAAGNMESVKPGIRPITDGPSKIPPSTSPTTRGWRRYPRGKWRARQTMRIRHAWMRKSIICRDAGYQHGVAGSFLMLYTHRVAGIVAGWVSSTYNAITALCTGRSRRCNGRRHQDCHSGCRHVQNCVDTALSQPAPARSL